jgi:hypothetical protein
MVRPSILLLAAVSVLPLVSGQVVFGARLDSYSPPSKPLRSQAPDHVEPYYSGPPCPDYVADRTYSQFQVNLVSDLETATGTLVAGRDGQAFLRRDDGAQVRLVSNASRIDWLLSYPYIDTEVRVIGRSILAPDCTVRTDVIYAEAVYPSILLEETIAPELDLRMRSEHPALRLAVEELRKALEDGRAGRDGGAVSRLENELFEDEVASAIEPWRVLLAGPEEPLPTASAVDLVLSGSNGGAGLFGHIAVGIEGGVYNVYPKGSDRGAPTEVPLGEYLFSAKRGQAVHRPSWVLRVEGLPERVVEDIREAIRQQVDRIDSGERPYHPTKNNCVTTCLASLEPVGIKVSKARYFTRRFPRPVFSKVLRALPRIVEKAGPEGIRIELWYVPQVGIRPLAGGAPNRPMWDGTRLP